MHYKEDTNCWLNLSIIFLFVFCLLGKWAFYTWVPLFKAFFVWWVKEAASILKIHFSFPHSFSAYTRKADGALCWGDHANFFCISMNTSDQIKTPSVIRLVWAVPHCIFQASFLQKLIKIEIHKRKNITWVMMNWKELLGQQSKHRNGYFYNILYETHQFTLSVAAKLQLHQRQESQHIAVLHLRTHCQLLS